MITTEEWRKRHNTEYIVLEICSGCGQCPPFKLSNETCSEFGADFDIRVGMDTLARTGNMFIFLGFRCLTLNRWILGLI
jgi:hypothetical protein